MKCQRCKTGTMGPYQHIYQDPDTGGITEIDDYICVNCGALAEMSAASFTPRVVNIGKPPTLISIIREKYSELMAKHHELGTWQQVSMWINNEYGLHTYPQSIMSAMGDYRKEVKQRGHSAPA